MRGIILYRCNKTTIAFSLLNQLFSSENLKIQKNWEKTIERSKE